MKKYALSFRFRGWSLGACLVLAQMWCASAGQAQNGCLLRPVALAERVAAAPLIVEARVAAQRVQPSRGHLFTLNELTVFKVFSGTLPAQPVLVAEPGGTLGLQQERVGGTADLAPAMQGVFMLEPDPTAPGSGKYRLYAGPQGFIRYELPARTAVEPFARYASIAAELYPALTRLTGQPARVVQANADLEAPLPPRRAFLVPPSITGFSPPLLTAGTETVLTIVGNNFGATRGNGWVEFPNSDTGGSTYIAANPSDYLQWSDTQIQVRVPSQVASGGGTAGTGRFRVYNDASEVGLSPTALVVRYALSNAVATGGTTPSRPRLVNDDTQGGYTLQYTPGFVSRTGAPESFGRALATWTCGARLRRVVSATTAPDVADLDNVNAVRFGAALEVPNGVLARTNSYYSGCIIGGVVFFSLVETDYTFNTTTNWQFGGPTRDPATGAQYDFESVALHELGHGQQLNHIIDPAAVMHYSIANAQNKRTLNPDSDVAGGQDVFAFSVTNPCPAFAPPIAAPVPPACNAVAVAEPNSRVAGLVLYPVPVAEMLHLDGLPATRPGQLRLYDATGRLALSQALPAGPAAVSVRGLAPGLYQVEWTDGAAVQRGRIIKQ